MLVARMHACMHAMQAHNKVPDAAWEYQMRKQLNDAAYNSLDYVPYCSTMPVPAKCDDPKFMWVSHQGGRQQSVQAASRAGVQRARLR